MGNRHLAAFRLREAHRRQVHGRLADVAAWGAPALVAAGLLPLVRPVFLHFLDDDPAGLASGVAGFATRLGLLVTSLVTLDVYAALVRGEDRAVLDLLPVDPAEVVAFELRRVAERQAPWLVAAAVLLAPIAPVSPVGAGAALLSVATVWALAIPASALAHLGAVRVAESTSWRPVLDLVRGSVPAEQAAFIYAPGVVLAAVGTVAFGVGEGVAAAARGQWLGVVGVIAPLVVAGVAGRAVGGLARGTWARAAAIVADVDARYSAIEQQEDGAGVYLDWIVRYLPAPLRPFALKDLRHGWRERRTWIFAAWALGVAGALAGWSAAATAPGSAALVVGLGGVGLATVAVWMDRDDPPFLRLFLVTDGPPARGARGVVVLSWLVPAFALPIPAVALRHGVADAAFVGGAGAAAVVGSVVLAVAASSRGGLAAYLPAATVWLVAIGALARASGWS